MTEPRPADAPAPGLHPIGSDPVDPAAAERAAVDAARAIPYAVWAPHAESVDLVLVDTEPGLEHVRTYRDRSRRTPRGRDIDAACGQLKTAAEKKSRAQLDREAEQKGVGGEVLAYVW